MTEIHEYLLNKNGILCRICFEEATKLLFEKEILDLAPWEESKKGLYQTRLKSKPVHWGLRLWEKSMATIQKRKLVDTDSSGDILCFHNGGEHGSESIAINGSGKKFLSHIPHNINVWLPNELSPKPTLIGGISSDLPSPKRKNIVDRLGLHPGALRTLLEALDNDRLAGNPVNATAKRKELGIHTTLAKLRSDLKRYKLSEVMTKKAKEELLSLLD